MLLDCKLINREKKYLLHNKEWDLVSFCDAEEMRTAIQDFGSLTTKQRKYLLDRLQELERIPAEKFEVKRESQPTACYGYSPQEQKKLRQLLSHGGVRIW